MDSEFAKLTNQHDFDPRTVSYINIVDTYNRKTGEHLKSVCTTPSGDTIWEEGRTSAKDVVFVDYSEQIYTRSRNRGIMGFVESAWMDTHRKSTREVPTNRR